VKHAYGVSLDLNSGVRHKSRMTAHARLRRFVSQRKLSIAELASRTGLDNSTLSKILAGKRSAGITVANAIERFTSDWHEGPIHVAEWLGGGRGRPTTRGRS
jgi:transcriptional regulator with XRE-family HTH domain